MSDNDFFGGRRRRRAGAAFSPYSLFASGEQGVWYDPSDLTPEKVSWRRNLLTYSQDFENAAWTKSNASILSNLALYSQDFDNAAWAKTNATVTANTSTAPDGTTTADKLIPVVAATDGRVIETVTGGAAGVTYTFSAYGKAVDSGFADFRLFVDDSSANSARVSYNILTGVVTSAATTTGTWTAASSTIADVGNGWYRVTITFTTTGAALTRAMVWCRDAGNGTSGILVWGAQLVPGSTAQTYTRSLATAAPIMFSDPLGGTLADKLVEDTSLVADHRVVSAASTFAVGTTYTSSLYAKAAERSFVRIFVLHVASTSFTVNLANGSIQFQSNSGNVTASATLVGNGWYRIQYTYLVTVASASAPVYAVIAYNATGTVTGTGDGTSGVYFFGAQAEQASTASAYQRITDFSSDFLAAFPTHALFQESTGVTPVTALGQSVGLVLDKRLGGASNLGAELVSNGDFSNGSTGWTTTNWIVSGGAAEVINAIDSIAQNISLTAGKTYRVTYTVRSFSGTGGVRPRFFGGTTVTGTTVSSAGTFSEYLVAVTGNTQVAIASTSSTCAIIVDNISVREVPGNHAIQATSASRPTLQARNNLLIATEQFDTWTAGTTTITTNATTSPDGTVTADLIGATVTNSTRSRSVTFTGDGEKCFAIYLKTNTSGRSQLGIFDSTASIGRHYINVTWTGGVPAISTALGAGTLYPVEAFANGWYRISFSATGIIAANSHVVAVVPDNLAGTNSIYAWGAQAENATVPTTYQRVVTATDYADVGLPRNLTFDGIDDSLATAGNVDFATWTVGTRRNLLTVPTMFDDATWNKTRSSITPNAIVAPDGTLTGDKLVEDTTAANSHFTNQTITLTANTTYTLSVYAKAGERNFIALQTGNIANWSAQVVSYFNLTTGVVTASTGPAGTMVDAGNGWWRCSITGTFGASTTIGALNILLATTTSDAFSYTGNGTSGVFLWGAQLEVGSTATAFQDVGTDKVSLFSGLFKASDAAIGMVTELSASVSLNNGTFYLSAPNSAAGANYAFVSKGTSSASQTTSATAPDTAVVTGLGNIGAPSAIIRRNGVQSSNATTQGTGNYGTYPLYVGRRGGSTLPFNGRLFQLVIRGAATDSVTVGNAERWVGQLTGVTL